MKMITKAQGGSFYKMFVLLESYSYLARGGRENHCQNSNLVFCSGGLIGRLSGFIIVTQLDIHPTLTMRYIVYDSFVN